MTTCYVCGGYSARQIRHRDCEPRFRRHRFGTCDRCGGLSRGSRHRSCEVAPKDYRPCGYCGAATRGEWHNRCTPIAMGELAMFPDSPGVVQRRCSTCRDWFPFAAVDSEEAAGTLDSWTPHGRSHGQRPVYSAMCRACMAQARRRWRVA